ncbi:unnamed protein product [Prorocentrum cordatum]|uniref:Protein kinase domain-containing protein n=1 Tax=Prorocentrum cordatum TaxID=2364126 RepID=A0ABN9W9L9_9DINO|nr:unnamed protein product [Polarella glacialis]
MERSQVVHGDLKCSNVFVERTCCPRSLPTAKLLDFGLSRALTMRAKPLGGTLRWVAPEVLRGSSPDTAADMFSFGCLISFIITGRLPGSEVCPAHPQTDWSARGWLAQACEPLVAECCGTDASRRPRAQQVHEQANVWLEALLQRGEQLAGSPAGAGGGHAPGPPADAAALRASRLSDVAGRAAQEMRLVVPSCRRTPAATVDGMMCDLLLCCNFEIPVQVCCPFHAALAKLARAIAKRVDGPCKPWSTGGTSCRQCARCGLLCWSESRDFDEGVSCNFCGSVNWELDAGGNNSLPSIPEASAKDEMEATPQPQARANDRVETTPRSQASDGTACGLAI